MQILTKLSRNKWKIVLYAVAAAALMAIAVQGLMIKQLYSSNEQFRVEVFSGTIISAITGLDRELAVDPLTGKLSVPSLRIVFPASPAYHYLSRATGTDSAISFIDAGNQSQSFSQMRSASSLADQFNNVATAQNCSRQVTLSIGKVNSEVGIDNLKLVTQKVLKDGRSAYIYQIDSCPYPATNLLDQIKQVESL